MKEADTMLQETIVSYSEKVAIKAKKKGKLETVKKGAGSCSMRARGLKQ
jgi:hypothetical protein